MFCPCLLMCMCMCVEGKGGGGHQGVDDLQLCIVGVLVVMGLSRKDFAFCG